MSPFLFVLAMEYLSRQFELLMADTSFSYHPKCSKLGLTHLCFADDLMVFCRADVPAVESVSKVLSQFGQLSGLVMNPLKSMVYLGGVPSDVNEEILRVTGMRHGSMPLKYLGIPLHQKCCISLSTGPFSITSKRK